MVFRSKQSEKSTFCNPVNFAIDSGTLLRKWQLLIFKSRNFNGSCKKVTNIIRPLPTLLTENSVVVLPETGRSISSRVFLQLDLKSLFVSCVDRQAHGHKENFSNGEIRASVTTYQNRLLDSHLLAQVAAVPSY
eukprot:Gb_01841 [translate_table: standard]